MPFDESIRVSDPPSLEKERERIGPVLEEVLSRHLPPGVNRQRAAAILMGEDGPARERLVARIDHSIAQAAKHHLPGISPAEGAGTESYMLGRGDQKVYAAMQDSNVINAVLGRQNTPSANDLMEGVTHGGPVPPPGKWATPQFMDAMKAGRLGSMVTDYELSKNDPTHHSNFLHSYYPQHQWTGGNTGALPLQNTMAQGGDTYAGWALSLFNTGPNAGARAVRRDSDLAPGMVNDIGKFVYNFPRALGEARANEQQTLAVGRASPVVPDGMRPAERREYIKEGYDLAGRSQVPSSQEYAASQGRTRSPVGEWWDNVKYEWIDPTVATTGAFGAAKTFAAKGLLGGLTRAPVVAAAAMADEVTEPMNYPLMAASFPFTNPDKWKAPKLSELPGDMGKPEYPEIYAERQRDSDRAIGRIRERQKSETR